MAQSGRKSRKQIKNSQFVTSRIGPELLKQIEAEAAKERYKSTLYDRVINEYMQAWNAGDVPRAYLGAADGIDKTFYLKAGTEDDLRAISAFDGIPVSYIIRTAFAWYLSRDCDCADPWCSDDRNSHRRPFALPSQIPDGIEDELVMPISRPNEELSDLEVRACA